MLESSEDITGKGLIAMSIILKSILAENKEILLSIMTATVCSDNMKVADLMNKFTAKIPTDLEWLSLVTPQVLISPSHKNISMSP
jgi:hypothetical protein